MEFHFSEYSSLWCSLYCFKSFIYAFITWNVISIWLQIKETLIHGNKSHVWEFFLQTSVCFNQSSGLDVLLWPDFIQKDSCIKWLGTFFDIQCKCSKRDSFHFSTKLLRVFCCVELQRCVAKEMVGDTSRNVFLKMPQIYNER